MATHVALTDPWLLRLITSFQAGIPFNVYVFWLAHDAPTAQSKAPNLLATNEAALRKLIVAHGSTRLLELFEEAQYWDTRYDDATLRKGSCFFNVPELAAEHNRVDVLQWMIDHEITLGDPSKLWRAAAKNARPDDFTTIEFLQTHYPLTAAATAALFGYRTVNDIRVGMLRWLHINMPMAVEQHGGAFAAGAAQRGDVAMMRFVHEHMAADAIQLSAFEIAYDKPHFFVLGYLMEHRSDVLTSSRDETPLLSRILKDTRPVVQALTRKHGVYERLLEDAAACNDWSLVDNWHARGLLATLAPISIDRLMYPKGLRIVRFLHQKKLATATTDAMDTAAECGAWELVDFLHTHRTEGCTTRAADAAVKSGDLARVRRFHEHYNVGFSSQAMINAAGCQSIDGLRFLHAQGCAYSTEAMDVAARSGRLHVVKFLYEHQPESYTAAAMENAADGGQLHVVQFLLKHRPETLTRTAIAAALRNGHLPTVRVLYDHNSDLLGADYLPELLLHGAFDIYDVVAGKFPEEAGRIVEDVIFAAGKMMQLPTIHFIIREMGREDLAHRAMDGAALTCNAQWIQAVYALTGPGSCHLSAVYNAVAAEENRSRNKWPHIQFLVEACDDPNAKAYAIATAQELHSDLYDELVYWDEFDERTHVPTMHPLLRDPRTPAWIFSVLFPEPGAKERCKFARCKAPLPWPIRAIYRHDLPLLQVVRDLPTSVEVKKRRAYYSGGLNFSFEGARAAAVRMGDLTILEWLLTNVDLPVETTLLDEAVYYHQYEIAEWLLVNYPLACTELDWTDKTLQATSGDVGLQGGLLEWLEAHESVGKAMPFTGIIDFAARTNDVVSLKRLHQWYPELFTPRPSLVALADLEECSDTINFFLEIGWLADVFCGTK